MFKTTALDSVANRYIDEDEGTSTPGTRLEAGDRNIEMDELVNAVEGAGLTLDPTGVDRDQLLEAMTILGLITKNALINGSMLISQRHIDWNAGFPEKVTDGVFAGPATWTYGAGWAHDGVNFEADATASNADLEQNVGAIADETYKITFTIKNYTGGTIQPQIGGMDGSTFNANGTYVQRIKATGTGNLKFQAAAATCSIDDVSVIRDSLANNDDIYTLDQWLLLSDGNNIVGISQSTDAPVGALLSCSMDVETINKKFGLFQIIEQKNCQHMIGDNISLSFEARVTDITKLDNIKVMILSWDGVADAPTSDIISAWNAEDTNPTLVANWTAENTPANLGVTASWAKYKIENIAIDTASTKNIGVFIWSDGFCDTVGKILRITNVQLEKNSIATEFEWRSVGQELALCQRYYCKSYRYADVPGTANDFGGRGFHVSAVANADHSMTYTIDLPTAMRTNPTTTVYDFAGISGKVVMMAGNGIAGTVADISDSGFAVSATNGAASISRRLRFQYVANAEIGV